MTTSERGRATGVQMWAVAGVAIILGDAAWRLGMRGIETVRGGLEPFEWLALGLLTSAFVYGEGVRALQRRWVPYILARVQRLRTETSLVYRVLAPLYAMALTGPTRRSLAAAWAGVAAIVLAVVLVSRLPDPWRGIVDLAVAAALVWGVGSLLVAARTVRVSNRST